jgi:hypothetical protein
VLGLGTLPGAVRQALNARGILAPPRLHRGPELEHVVCGNVGRFRIIEPFSDLLDIGRIDRNRRRHRDRRRHGDGLGRSRRRSRAVVVGNDAPDGGENSACGSPGGSHTGRKA